MKLVDDIIEYRDKKTMISSQNLYNYIVESLENTFNNLGNDGSKNTQ